MSQVRGRHDATPVYEAAHGHHSQSRSGRGYRGGGRGRGRGGGRGRGYRPHPQPYYDEGQFDEQSQLQGGSDYYSQGAVGGNGGASRYQSGGGSHYGRENYRRGHGNYQSGRRNDHVEGGHGRSTMHGHDFRDESRSGRNSSQISTGHNHSGEQKHVQRSRQNLQISCGTRYLSREQIKELACGDPDNLITFITDNESSFLATYSQPRCCSHPLTLKYLIKLLYLLAKSEDDLAARIVAHVFNDTDSANQGTSAFRSDLEVLIRKMPGEMRAMVIRENPQYLSYIIDIGDFAIETAPMSVRYTFPCLSLNDTVKKLPQGSGKDLHLLAQKAQALADKFDRAQMPQSRLINSAYGIQTNSQPPEHFTELPVLPSANEVHPYAAKPFLRPNIVKGAYTDWEHYLDVQFRLMREDFVAPLRDGIKYYEREGATSKEVMVYEGVSVCNTACLYSGVGFQIRFDVTRFQRMNWEHSKRLIFGSLLCLSDDGFYTIFLATVIKRDAKLLKDGLVTVQFESAVLEEVLKIDPSRRFTMVESTAYFEAYRHILEGLQRASAENLTDQLPLFKRYLVDCQLNPPVPAPRYIRYSENPEFRLKEVLGIKNGSPNIMLTNDWSWPADKNTSLDPSQLYAFRAALTQEVSVIQGPPGTGKTFIGLKVVEALVANQDKSNHFPLLVLCYTNHALDQFLEGIIEIKEKFNKDLNVLRIGGRCKTKSLEGCILKSKIDDVRSQRALPIDLYKESSRLNKDIRACQEQIQRVQKSVDVTENKDKIFKLSVLRDIINQIHYSQLTTKKPTQRGREIDVWLKLWYTHGDEDAPFADELFEYQDPEDNDDSADDQSDSDEYIDVDAEASMLEDERMIEGEEFELAMSGNQFRIQNELYAANTHDQQLIDDSQWNIAQLSEKERRHRIRKGHSNQPMSQYEANSIKDIWKLSLQKRWSLYLHWVNELIRNQKELIVETVKMYNEVCKEYTTCRQEIDAFVIRDANIIGMTTTGAAKYNHILSNIHPKIIIIEEAAEVFEAHVFTSLTPSVQQLIMIGDHKQLRPKANCYNLEKNYELCVSLFERLAMNGFPVHTLEVQHRMRPEIASLIRPTIYEKLLNHEDVTEYEHVKGVGSDVFFIDHSKPEKSAKDKDRSHSNEHEADFLVALCKYLLKQGYHPQQITVLTMYRGQLLELKKKMKRQDYSGVRVAAVDDFQGEENDIILLSLVRSNPDGKIGFLEIENRICVSLSRAKIGLYVIGNLSMLRDKDYTVWPQILADLSQKGCTGKALPLQCQVHPESKVMASSSNDFLKCPEGGCQQKCAVRLKCGHSCPRLCHPIDKEHKNTKCQQMCAKVLDCGHNCEQKCYKCKDGCPPCTKTVVRRLYPCRHEVKMPCNRDPSTFTCPKQCSKLLICGHICQEICSRPCTRDCRANVEKDLPCGHIGVVPCCIDVSTITTLCEMPCKALLDCGHPCVGNCWLCQKGRLHIRCQSNCGRTLVCGHQCKFPCTPTCPPCMEKCNNHCGHSKCQQKCYEPCVPCKQRCKWKCEHFKCTRLCGEMCNRPPCNEPCKKTLKCGHPCIGLCGEKCPRKCRICNKDEVCEIFFGNEADEDARFIKLEDCKHLIEVTACDTWMAQAADESKPSEVQFKCCPKCNTQIRKSLRYGNIIKQTLEDYEIIKEQQLVSLSSNLLRKFTEVQVETMERISPILTAVKEKLEQIEQSFSHRHESQTLLPHQVNNVNAQLTYLTTIVKIAKHLMSLQSNAGACSNSGDVNDGVKDIQDGIMILIDFLMQDFLSDQQKSDIQSEIYRLMGLTKLLDLGCKTDNVNLSESDGRTLSTMFVQVHESGWKSDKLTEKEYDNIIEFITKISSKYRVSGLTDSEKTEIVKAIGLTKGHWFKCPNGHFYCIGECGGAMEEAKCPECGAKIGGQRHTLRADNQLASEMDGASHAACMV